MIQKFREFSVLDWRKIFFHFVTSVEQRKNSESPRGIEPQTFGFPGPLLYH